MPKLADNVLSVLEDINSLNKVPETAPDAIDIEPQFLEELETLANITKSELACRFSDNSDFSHYSRPFRLFH